MLSSWGCMGNKHAHPVNLPSSSSSASLVMDKTVLESKEGASQYFLSGKFFILRGFNSKED